MGKPSKRSWRERRKRGRWRGAEEGTGAKIRKLKKCRPALERDRELSMSAYAPFTA